ncbi:hypothetical protein GOV12_01480 [Candidatus Pacearchaeota archaeon]|nr:hypothetical protein [Candidatus Pacearchaeota archaeon]
MTEFIFGNLKNGSQVILFDEESSEFSGIKKIFDIKLNDIRLINFLENMNSNLDEDEIYSLKISGEDESSFFSKILLKNNTADYNKATQDDYKNINLIYLLDDSREKIYFKKVYPTQHIGSKRILGFGDLGPTYKKEGNKISLSNKVDVVYDINKKTFYFNSFNVLKLIFSDIVKFYRNATKEEASSFFSDDSFEYKDSVLDNTTDKLKKQLKMIIDKKIDFTDNNLIKKYEKYAKKYNHDLKKENDKFLIKTKAQLKTFVKVFEEVFYETDITKEMREIDNFRKIS